MVSPFWCQITLTAVPVLVTFLSSNTALLGPMGETELLHDTDSIGYAPTPADTLDPNTTPVREWSSQQLFDYVAKHLVTQGRAAMSGAACCYRTPSGDMCAVGCLIPDADYEEWFEGHTLELLPDLEALLGVDHSKLLHSLQIVHDYSLREEGISAARRQLYSVAANFGLSSAALDTALAAQVPV